MKVELDTVFTNWLATNPPMSDVAWTNWLATNTFATTNWVDIGYYPRSNPSNYVDRTVTNGLVGTEKDPLWEIWRTNSAAGSTNAILPNGSLVDISTLLGGSGTSTDTLQQVVNRGNSATNVGALTMVGDIDLNTHKLKSGSSSFQMWYVQGTRYLTLGDYGDEGYMVLELDDSPAIKLFSNASEGSGWIIESLGTYGSEQLQFRGVNDTNHTYSSYQFVFL